MPDPRIALFIACLATTALGACGTSVVAVVGVHVVTMEEEGNRILTDQTVLVARGRIVAMGPRDLTKVPRGAARIDGAGRYLMPGLHDLYAHVDESALPLFLAHGVTTVRNTMPGLPRHLALRDAVRRGAVVGPRILTSGPPIAGAEPFYSSVEAVSSPDTARAIIAQQQRAGYDGVAVYTDIEPAVWRAVLEEAQRLDIPVWGHLPYKVPRDTFFLGRGQRSKENLLGEIDLRSGQTWVPPEALRHYAERTATAGIPTIPTLTIHAARARPDRGIDRIADPEMPPMPPRQLQHWLGGEGRAYAVGGNAYSGARDLVRHLHAAGAPILLGSDAGYPFVAPGASIHEELALLVDAGLTPYAALSGGTREAARFLGTLDRSGTVAVGKDADLLLVRGDPLANVSNAARIDGVMRGGIWYARDELDFRLEERARTLVPPPSRLGPSPAWRGEEPSAHYEIRLRGVVVGEERISRRARRGGGASLIAESAIDPHVPTRTSLRVDFDARGQVVAGVVRRTEERLEQRVEASVTPHGTLEIRADAGPGGRHVATLPFDSGAVLAGPLLAVNLDADLAVNLQMAIDRVERATATELAVPAVRIELNFEEFGARAIAGTVTFRVRRSGNGRRYEVVLPNLNGSAGPRCDVGLADDGLLASASCGDIEWRRIGA